MKEAQETYSSYVLNCVFFNAFLCYTNIVLNSVTIYALRKTSTLPEPLKTLLLSLAVSDLGVGLMAQPTFIAYLAMELKRNTGSSATENISQIAFRATANLFGFTSFFGVTALSADRFLAIHLHLRYQELVTHKRVVAVVISKWLFSAILSIMRLIIPENISFAIFVIICLSCLLTTTLFYYKIYLAVRRHANQIQTLQVQQAQNVEMAGNAATLRKFAAGTFFVYLAFLVCYLPNNFVLIIAVLSGTSTTIKGWHLYTLTLGSLNSSINPLIYCWKMKQIRHAIMDILRNILERHNRRIADAG